MQLRSDADLHEKARLKDLASEMAVSGDFNEAHGDPAKLPETEQEILDDGSVRITMKMESKHVDGHRRVVIPAPGAERLKQTSLLRVAQSCDWSGYFDFLSAFLFNGS